MSAQEKKTSQTAVRTVMLSTDRILAVAANTANGASPNTVTVQVGINDLLTNTSNLHVNVAQLTISSNLGTPANSTAVANIAANILWSDGNYIYVSVANNTIKRLSSPLVTF